MAIIMKAGAGQMSMVPTVSPCLSSQSHQSRQCSTVQSDGLKTAIVQKNRYTMTTGRQEPWQHITTQTRKETAAVQDGYNRMSST